MPKYKMVDGVLVEVRSERESMMLVCEATFTPQAWDRAMAELALYDEALQTADREQARCAFQSQLDRLGKNDTEAAESAGRKRGNEK